MTDKSMTMFNQFEFPAQSASKHSNVFDHYAAAQLSAFPAPQSTGGQQWNDDVFYPMSEQMSEQQQQQQFQTPAMTISPEELLSTASTVNNCFSDVDHTPLIEETDLSHDASTWAPLFTFEEIVKSESVDVSKPVPIAPQAPLASREEKPSFAKALAAEVDRKLKRKEVDQVKSPVVASNKVDKMGITMYNRKPRQTPLRPVDLPDNADNATAKRARNTEAARRSRARKMERMSQLEERVSDLSRENDALQAEIDRLKRKCGEV